MSTLQESYVLAVAIFFFGISSLYLSAKEYANIQAYKAIGKTIRSKVAMYFFIISSLLAIFLVTLSFFFSHTLIYESVCGTEPESCWHLFQDLFAAGVLCFSGFCFLKQEEQNKNRDLSKTQL